jgi:hypothetical protein
VLVGLPSGVRSEHSSDNRAGLTRLGCGFGAGAVIGHQARRAPNRLSNAAHALHVPVLSISAAHHLQQQSHSRLHVRVGPPSCISRNISINIVKAACVCSIAYRFLPHGDEISVSSVRRTAVSSGSQWAFNGLTPVLLKAHHQSFIRCIKVLRCSDSCLIRNSAGPQHLSTTESW